MIKYNIDDEVDNAKITIKDIFSVDNMPTILLVLNSCLPRSAARLQTDAYTTAIAAAKYDASVEFINAVITKTNDLRLK